MEELLTDLGKVLCKYYPPSANLLYPLRKLNISMTRIKHTLRKEIISEKDKKYIHNVIIKLSKYELDQYQLYYRNLLIDKLFTMI